MANGPSSVSSSVPRPTVSSRNIATTPSVNSSASDSWTMNRFGAMQTWPPLRSLAAFTALTALSTSPSSRTTNGALPPSSSETFIDVSMAFAASAWPTSVEPVKVNLRRRSSSRMAETFFAVPVGSTWTTPAGTPASSSSFARYSMVSGVFDAGLAMIVQPAASAGAILRAPMASGKFHGVIARVGPTGWRTVTRRERPSGERR